MKKENMANTGEVKSTVNSLECSPSKGPSKQGPLYVKQGKSGKGGGFKKGK